MPRYTTDQKLIKGLKFLMSMRKPDIAELMVQRGFSDESLNEGWDLFYKATKSSLPPEEIYSNRPMKKSLLLKKIDEWENIWLNVADAALSRKYPKLRDEMLSDIKHETGINVIPNVIKFIQRYQTLAEINDKVHQNAIKLLQSRGLNKKNIDEITHTLQMVQQINPVEDYMEEIENELKKAQELFWDWYIDWSKTARTIVNQKKLRIIMGISSKSIKEETLDKPKPLDS